MRISERDWKAFKKVTEAALQRFCERAITDVEAVCCDSTRSFCDRYHAVAKLMRDRDKEMADAFDEIRRSTAIRQLALMRSRGLVSDEEMSMLAPETQNIIAEICRA